MGSLKILYLLVTVGDCNGKSSRIEEENNLECDLTKSEKFIQTLRTEIFFHFPLTITRSILIQATLKANHSSLKSQWNYLLHSAFILVIRARK